MTSFKKPETNNSIQIDSIKLLIEIIVAEALRQKKLGGSTDEIIKNITDEYLKSQGEV